MRTHEEIMAEKLARPATREDLRYFQERLEAMRDYLERHGRLGLKREIISTDLHYNTVRTPVETSILILPCTEGLWCEVTLAPYGNSMEAQRWMVMIKEGKPIRDPLHWIEQLEMHYGCSKEWIREHHYFATQFTAEEQEEAQAAYEAHQEELRRKKEEAEAKMTPEQRAARSRIEAHKINYRKWWGGQQLMTEREYQRFTLRLRAYRRAFWRFVRNMEPAKAAAILPRLKMQEAEEITAYNSYINN